MAKTYYEGRFIFTVVEKEVFEQLKKVEPERWFISAANIEKIRNILKMEQYTDEELQGLRNTIVKDFDDESYDDFTRISMVTAVIDNEKVNRGMAV